MTVGQLLAAGHRCDRTGPLWRDFLEFHHANPWVYDRLKKICADLRHRGFRYYSTRTIISVLRFEWDLQTGGSVVDITGGARQVKLNDHHSPYYARMLIEEKPEYADFFELRVAEGDPDPNAALAQPASSTGFLDRLRARLAAR